MTPSLVAFCNDSMSYCRVQLMRHLPRAATSPRLQRCSEFACRMPQGVSQLHTEYYRQDPAQHPCKCALAKTRAARTRRHTQYPASDANWSRCKAPTLSRCRCRSWRGAMHVDHKLSVNNPKPTTCRSQCAFRNRIRCTTIEIQLINPASVQMCDMYNPDKATHSISEVRNASKSRCLAPTLSRCRCRSWRGAKHVDP